MRRRRGCTERDRVECGEADQDGEDLEEDKENHDKEKKNKQTNKKSVLLIMMILIY